MATIQPEPPTHSSDFPEALGSYTFSILTFHSSFLRWCRRIAHHALFITEYCTLCNVTFSLFRAVSCCGGVAWSTPTAQLFLLCWTGDQLLICFYCILRTRGQYPEGPRPSSVTGQLALYSAQDKLTLMPPGFFHWLTPDVFI